MHTQNLDSKKIAAEKFDRALALIEKAQYLLSDACAELCPLEGAIEPWELVGKHYDLIHDLWRSVVYNTPRNRLDLDEDSKRRLLAKLTITA